tara:strand:+ start:183 stop:467 length:285 start_codon:yes stop_codon:yes gene_type:complete
MSDYTTYGKATIFHNEDANKENKRPDLSGSIKITEDIPAGTLLRIAGWSNFQGSVLKSVGMNLSSKVGGESDDNYKKQTSGTSYKVDKDENIPF